MSQFIIENLQPDTSYWWFVRAKDGGDISGWRKGPTFTTLRLDDEEVVAEAERIDREAEEQLFIAACLDIDRSIGHVLTMAYEDNENQWRWTDVEGSLGVALSTRQ